MIPPSPQPNVIAVDIAADELMARSIAALTLAQSIRAWPAAVGERRLAPRPTPFHSPESATVYLYKFWDENKSQFVTAMRAATLDCIRCGLGTPLLTSGRQVALYGLGSHPIFPAGDRRYSVRPAAGDRHGPGLWHYGKVRENETQCMFAGNAKGLGVTSCYQVLVMN